MDKEVYKMTEQDLSNVLTEEFKGRPYGGYSSRDINLYTVSESLKKLLTKNFPTVEFVNGTTNKYSIEMEVSKSWSDGSLYEAFIRVDIKRQKDFYSNKWYVKEIKVIFLKAYDGTDVDDLEQTIKNALTRLDLEHQRKNDKFNTMQIVYEAIVEKCKELNIEPRDAVDYIHRHWYKLNK